MQPNTTISLYEVVEINNFALYYFFTPDRDDEIREVLKSGKLLRIKLENDA